MVERKRAQRRYAAQMVECRWVAAWEAGDRSEAERLARVAGALRALGI